MTRHSSLALFFFFNDTATTEIYTLSLHDALPISPLERKVSRSRAEVPLAEDGRGIAAFFQDVGQSNLIKRHAGVFIDRKSTRLNSSHLVISYAVFCLKKELRDFAAGLGAAVARAR